MSNPIDSGTSLGGSGSTAEQESSRSGDSAVGLRGVDQIAAQMNQVQINQRAPPGGRNSSASSNSSGAAPRRGMQPIAKKDLPYMSQTFVERPFPLVEESSIGRQFFVEANFYPVKFPNEIRCYQYDVMFTMDGRKGEMEMRKAEFTSKAFWFAVKTKPGIFPEQFKMAYNGVNMLYTTEKLKFSTGQHKISFQSQEPRPKTYNMLIKFATMVALKPNPQSTADQMNLVTVLDEVLTARLTCLFERDHSNDFHKQGKSVFYNPQDPNLRKYVFSLGAGLQAWTGLHGAIKPNLQGGLLLNVDVGHSVFFKTQCNLVNFYAEVVGNCPFDDGAFRQLQDKGMDMNQRNKLAAALKGKTLVYNMPPRQQGERRTKIFKFTAIAMKSASSHTFRDREGRQMSIAEYYCLTYNINLRCPYLPCICINKTKQYWAPMEFIATDRIVHKLKGKIPERQLRTMIQQTAFPPKERKQILLDMANVQDGNQNQPMYLAEQDRYMANFGVSVDRNLVQVKASLLPSPTLSFGEDVRHTDNDHTGVWELQHKDSLKKIKGDRKPKVIPSLIFMTPEADKGGRYDINHLPLGTLMEVLHNFGVSVPGGRDPFVVEKFDCWSQRWETLVGWMREFKKVVAEKYGPDASPLALFIFPYKCTTRRQIGGREYFSEYSMVKYICDVVVGVHSQCLLTETYTAMQGNPQSNATAQNVAIKVLGKLGATLCTLENNADHTAWSLMTNPEDPVLVLGIDVTHPGEQDRKEGKYAANSVACVVGNIDINCMQYEASVRAQDVGQERTLSVKDEVRQRMVAFETKSGKKPNHIVVYRDGVSESQFQETLHEELKAVKEACKEIAPDYEATVTYIVMTKRHHTRFFPINEQDTSGKAFNLKPGTLVESYITTKDYYDFYLISHPGPLGTSRPSHYYVLWDEWKPSSTHWQLVTNALAYGYVRCPKAISQPAPVMYAHLAAKRAKDYLMAHINVYHNRLDGMNEYELFFELKKHMQKHPELQGMQFV